MTFKELRSSTTIIFNCLLWGWFFSGCADGGHDSRDILIIDAMVGGSLPDDVMNDAPASDLAEASTLTQPPDWSLGVELPDAEGECADQDRLFNLSGRIFLDPERVERSEYTGSLLNDKQGIRPTMRIVGADDTEYTFSACDDGSYTIEGLEAGTYLVYPEILDGRPCTTRNCPGRFARALADNGEAVIVTLGDSIAVLGSENRFPQKLVSLFGGLGTINSRNMAMEGTTSDDWLPGGWLFDSRLRPHLVDADLFLITLGGNDILYFVDNYLSRGGIPTGEQLAVAVDEAREIIDDVVANLTAIMTAIRMANADADIAFLLYMNYSQATTNPVWNTVGTILGRETLAQILVRARDQFPEDDAHLLLVDLFGRFEGENISGYLADPLHMNNEGHVAYAEEIFRTLGGVLLGPSPLGVEGHTPIGLRRHFGVAP